VLKEEELVPAFNPFTFHWYEGEEPAFVTVALNETFAPAHTVVLPVEIVIAGAAKELTVIAMAFEVTDAGEAQVAFDVITHETRSLLLSVDDE
jgi:3-dehydroquinate synthase class II